MPYRSDGTWYDDDPIGTGRPDSAYEVTPTDYEAGTQWIPFDLLGGAAQLNARRAEAESRRNRDYWTSLAGSAPSVDDLAVDYGEEDFIEGPRRSELAGAQADPQSVNAQLAALRQLEEWGDPRMTAADRGVRDSMLRQQEQGARSQRDALMQQAEARGMGGSGQSLLMQMQANEGAQGRAADFDAAMMQAIQDRALQSIQARGALGSQMRGQSFNESATTRGAADDFARYQTDYARAREQRNNQWRNASRESRANASQQAYQNRERATAGATGQYSGDADRAQQRYAHQQAQQQQGYAALGDMIGSWVGGDDDD